MNTLKPASAFTSSSLAADFPALKLLFHADDLKSGDTTWTCRKSGVVLNFAAGCAKDANGMYTTVTNSVSSVTGTMPTPASYVVALAIGTLKTGSGTAGLATTFGATSPGPALLTSSAAFSNAAAALNTAPSLTGTISNSVKACNAGYWDLIDTTSPAIFRILASGSSADQAIANGSGTTTSTGQVVLGAALASAFTLGAFAANDDGRRTQIVALFDFSSALVVGDLELACAEMARTQELFAGWRNRA